MDYAKRIEKFKRILKKQNLEALILSDVANIAYLTGFGNFDDVEREAFLVITEDKQFIITDPRYSIAILEQVPHFELLERNHQTPLSKIFSNLAKNYQLIGIEGHNLTVEELNFLAKYFKKVMPVKKGGHRIAKQDLEIEFISYACQIGDHVFKQILPKLKLGVTEQEIAAEIEHLIKKQGADISFKTIVAFDKSSTVPHHQTGRAVLEIPKQVRHDNGVFILLDFGVKFNGYCSDMTRTIVFGKASQQQKKIYQTVLGSQKKAVEFIRNQLNQSRVIKASKVDEVARKFIKLRGFSSIPHGLGHGVGLQIHEAPKLAPGSKDKLTSGLVFSIEPGIYLPGVGGVRIEDLFYLTDKKLILLTHAPSQFTQL